MGMRAWMVLVAVLAGAVRPATGEDRLLPLGKSMAGGAALPLPYGVGVTLHKQDQDYALKSLAIDLPALDGALLRNLSVENSTGEANLKLDAWLLPFLNVFALIGRIEGETKVSVPPLIANLTIEYEGVVYGAGMTAAAGVGRWFAALTAICTDTSLDMSDSTVRAWVLNPRVGGTVATRRGSEVTCWLGAMYQRADEEHEGRIDVPGLGTVAYDVELEADEPWNMTAGLSTALSKRVSLELELGFLGRTQATGSLGWRF